ncbi:hypothetical protein G6F59_012192 [Rhizopus arrhizus]|nr:hypothetical protein G6F59_012192 [Rhizopus arrhizus]
MSLHPQLHAITERVIRRSAASRAAYLAAIDAALRDGPFRSRLSCGNLAHGFAACGGTDKSRLRGGVTPNLGIITAYNDMLSAHQPFETYPEQIRKIARELGATAQVAGAVPAMCDGVTQGRGGMELSLFSRDVIAQATAIGLSHDMFDTTVHLGVCDKIVPGLLIGALAFGHLPAVFVPAGPMTPGIPNKQKAAVRERYAAGEATREELLEAESASYHGAGTCTFYGTANSNQVLLEAMGVQLPGASFVNPDTALRDALTREATERALAITALGDDFRPLGRIIDERAIINAVIALMATGGSTNHTIHWIAVARAAGIVLTWDDFDELSQLIPLLARVYPNGEADVNRFAAAGGPAFVFGELIKAGLMHGDLVSVARGGMADYAREPQLREGKLVYLPGLERSADEEVVRSGDNPFESQAVGGEAAVPQHRGTGGGGRCAAGAEQAARRRFAARAFRGGGALPGPACERHAGTAFAGAAAGPAAEPGPARGAGHRRPPVRRLGQDSGGHPRDAGSGARWPAGEGPRGRHDPPGW